MKRNPFSKDPSRFGSNQLRIVLQPEPSIDSSFSNSSREQSLLLDGFDTQNPVKSLVQSEKESPKNERNPNLEQMSQMDSDKKSPTFIERIQNAPSYLFQMLLEKKPQSREMEGPNKFTNKTQEKEEVKKIKMESTSQFSKPKQEIENEQESTFEAKDSDQTGVGDNSFVNMSFGIYSPASRNIKNVPMTRSIITGGSPNDNTEIPSPQTNDVQSQQQIEMDQEQERQNSQISQNQDNSEDFPQAKSQKSHKNSYSNQNQQNPNPNPNEVSEEKYANSIESSENEQLSQQEISPQNSVFKNPQMNPFIRENKIQCKKNSKKEQKRIRRSKSHSQPHVQSKEKKLQPIICQKPVQKQTKFSSNKKLFKNSIIDRLQADNISEKGQPNQRTISDKMKTESHNSTISIHILDTNQTSSIFEFFQDKENRSGNQNLADQISRMQEETQKKTKAHQPIKKQAPMNQSIDFNSIKPKSRPKNTFLSTKNNHKNLKDRLTQKCKKEFDNMENLTEQKIMNRTRTENALSSFKDIVLKLIHENENEYLQNMADQMVQCMEEIEGATNMARLERKMMGKTLNKAKKHISTLKELNIHYENVLYELCQEKEEKLQKINEDLKGKFNEIGATVENGKIIFTEQMAQEYVELKRKQLLRNQKMQEIQKQRQIELKSLQNPKDQCRRILEQPSTDELFQMMIKGSQDKDEVILKIVNFRNMMINSYITICLKDYPNTIPERTALLKARDQDIFDAANKIGIMIPDQFINDTKRMLNNLQKFAKRYQEQMTL